MTLAEAIRTPDGFLERLHSMAPKVFAKAVADFTDADRRKLSKTAQEHAKALRKTALSALWLGLFAKDVDVRAVASDALTEGILDGRAHPDELSPALVDLLQHPWLKLNCLAEALTEVVRVSSWAAMVDSEVLNAVIASWNEVPRDGHHVLTVQLAALVEVDGQLPAAARQPLQQLKGSSKTAKLAKQLLALKALIKSSARKRAMLEAIQCRLQRLPQS